ncbi:hypothetical protein [Archaeoglobus sp.]
MRWLALVALLVLLGTVGMVEARGGMGHGHGVLANNTSEVKPEYHHYEHNYNTSCPECEHHYYNYSYNYSYNQSCENCNETGKGPMGVRGKRAVENVKVAYKRIRNAIENAKIKYKMARAKYDELKHRGLNDPETFRYAKMFIGSGIEVAKGWIEMLMVQIQHANMGEEQKSRLMVKLENELGILESLENKINTSETPEELRINVKCLKDNWSEIMVTIKSAIGQLAVAKLESLLDRIDNVTVKVESMISENDTKALTLLNDCKQKVEVAREKLELANEKFVSMENAENPNELWLEGLTLIKEAKDQIKLAFNDLKEIYVELKVVP